jgi:thiamine-phosphate pyrophosphorylase
VEDVAAVLVFATDELEAIVGLCLRGEREEACTDAVFGLAVGEVVAHVLDEVAVGGVVALYGDAEVIVIGFDVAVAGVFGRRQLGVGEVFVLVQEAAVQFKQLLVEAGCGGCDASVGDLFAADGAAFARSDTGVLDIDKMGTFGFGGVLVGSDAGHDGIGTRRRGRLLRMEAGCGGGEEQGEQDRAHGAGTLGETRKFHVQGRDFMLEWMRLPRLYAIVDAEVLASRGIELREFAGELCAVGVQLLQYRDKSGGPQEVLRNAAVIREVMAGSRCRLIMNDRADLAVLAGWDGVHVGQGDLSAEDAKAIVLRTMPTHRMKQGRDEWGTRIVPGSEFWVGASTHNEEQVRAADASCADYVAVGPVFVTGTKLDAEPVIGLDGVRRARMLTEKPIVAIGGITRANARSVIDAGADSVAVISALFGEGETVEKVARDFLEILR